MYSVAPAVKVVTNKNMSFVLGLKIQLGKKLELLPERPGRLGNENRKISLQIGTQSRYADLRNMSKFQLRVLGSSVKILATFQSLF